MTHPHARRPLSPLRIASLSMVGVVHAILALLLTFPPGAYRPPRVPADDVVVPVERLAPPRIVMPTGPVASTPEPAADRVEPVVESVPAPPPPASDPTADAGTGAPPTYLPSEVVLLRDTVPDFAAPQPDVAAEPVLPVAPTAEVLVVRVFVGVDGVADAVVVVGSSDAHPDRIDATLRALREMRFTPALRDGHAIASWLDLSVPLLTA